MFGQDLTAELNDTRVYKEWLDMILPEIEGFLLSFGGKGKITVTYEDGTKFRSIAKRRLKQNQPDLRLVWTTYNTKIVPLS